MEVMNATGPTRNAADFSQSVRRANGREGKCLGCGNVTAHQLLHDCAQGIPDTHMAGSERLVCELRSHILMATDADASRFPFQFDEYALERPNQNVGSEKLCDRFPTAPR
jgi:hypothetical protein